MKILFALIALFASTFASAGPCIGPYHVLAPDGRCVWSCSVGTTPDNQTGECVCKPGLAQTSLDRFNRRVCEQRPPAQCSGHMEFRGNLNSRNGCVGGLNVTVDVNANGQFNGNMTINPNPGANCDVMNGTVSGGMNGNQVDFTGRVPFNNAQVQISFTGQTNQPQCNRVGGQFNVPAWRDSGNYSLNR
jgi:hypothetical protein